MRILKKPVEQQFTLLSEEFGDCSVTIRQARVGDTIKRQDLVSEASLVINDKLLGQEIKQRINPSELRRFDVYLTLVDADIEAEDDKGKVTPWFTFVNRRLADQASFNIAYNSLPDEIAEAIYEKVLEVNPQWKQQIAEDLGE